MSIRALFWDNDGVLVDTERLYFDVTREVLAEVGITLTPADYLELFMRTSTGAWHLAEAAGLPAGTIERLKQARDERYSARLRREPLLVPGVTDVLQSLHGRFTMGIVSSAYEQHFSLIHARTGLLRYFDFALTGSDCTHVKPHPDGYLQALARTGLPPEACLAIEDSPRGLAAATAAGIRCVVVPNSLTREVRFTGAHAVLEAITALPELLDA